MKIWPENRIYSPESVGVDLHIAVIRHTLFSDWPVDRNTITRCIEEKSVHPHVEVRKITPQLIYRGPSPHPLAEGEAEYGVFAKKRILKGEDLGEYVGEIRLLAADAVQKESGTCYDWLVCWKNRQIVSVNAKRIANEMMIINDYRGLKEAPNVCTKWLVNRGFYYFGYAASREIERNEEIVVDYGTEWADFYNKKRMR